MRSFLKYTIAIIITLMCLFSSTAFSQQTKVQNRSGIPINPATDESINSLISSMENSTIHTSGTATITGSVSVVSSPVISSYGYDVLLASNSTTTPLASNATFTGSWVDAIGYSHITVMAIADQVGATNGVDIQHSSDVSNVDYHSYRTMDTTSGHDFKVSIQGRYVRVVYTNGTTTQGYFRMQSILRTEEPSASIMDIDAALIGHRNGLITKSLISGKTTAGGGSYVDVKVNPSGSLTADVSGSTVVVSSGTITAYQGDGWTVSAAITNSSVTINPGKGSTSLGPIAISTSTTSTPCFSANVNHRGRILHNESTVNLYYSLGTFASSTSHTDVIEPFATVYFRQEDFSGIVNCALSSGTGTALATEITQ